VSASLVDTFEAFNQAKTKTITC